MTFKNKSKIYKAAKFFPMLAVKREHVFSFGTVFFITSLLLLFGMFFFPAVRSMLHGSAMLTGFAPASVLSGEAPPRPIFTDVDTRHPNAEAINYLKDKHVISGYPDGSFKPDKLVTRAELLKLLFEAQKVFPSPAVYRACFKDAKDDWYAPYACYAKAKGLVQGYADGTFGPGNDVKVVEALKIILMAYNTKFLEVPPSTALNFEAGAWYAPYVWTAYEKKYITWETLVVPAQMPNLTKGTVTKALLKRAHLVEILYRLMK